LRALRTSVYLRVPSSNKNGTDGCRFPEFFFDVLAEESWNQYGTGPVTFRTVRPVHFPGKILAYETVRNRDTPPRPGQHAVGCAGALRVHRVHPALRARAARHRSPGH